MVHKFGRHIGSHNEPHRWGRAAAVIPTVANSDRPEG